LGIIINKLKEVCPQAFRPLEGDKAQIMIDSIDAPSFKALIALLETL